MKEKYTLFQNLLWHHAAGYEFVMWDCSDRSNYFLVLQKKAGAELFPDTAFIGFHSSAFNRVRQWVREIWDDIEEKI